MISAEHGLEDDELDPWVGECHRNWARALGQLGPEAGGLGTQQEVEVAPAQEEVVVVGEVRVEGGRSEGDGASHTDPHTVRLTCQIHGHKL